MRAIIHAGMQKTGSSSIQTTLAGHRVPGLYYPDWSRKGNHSALLRLLFEDTNDAKPTGRTARGVDRSKDTWMARIRDELTSGAHRRVLFSAERIANVSPEVMERLKAFFEPYCSEFEVIAYVRPPVGFITSAFQQNLKGPLDQLTLPWPNYRRAFEKLDTIFGRENVRLKLFRPDALAGGDVVVDFAAEIGIGIPRTAIRRVNDGLSLEAVALLFAQRHLGTGFQPAGADVALANERFIDALAEIGSQKLVFAPSLIEPMMEDNRADLEWMEARLGAPLDEEPVPSDRPVRSGDDLIAIAHDNLGALTDLVSARLDAQEMAPRERTILNLELLRVLTGEDWRQEKPRRPRRRAPAPR